jgi:hypothetical protein
MMLTWLFAREINAAKPGKPAQDFSQEARLT